MSFYKSIRLLFIACLFWLQSGICLYGQAFDVMTYNIRLDVSSDGANAWPNRKEKLLDLIQFYQPDIFGIQEALPHQVEAIAQRFAKYTKVGIGREGLGKGEASCLFLLTERFEVADSGTFWLSPTPDSISMGWDAACLRICTWARVTDRLNNESILIANTHFDHMGKVARQQSALLVTERLKELASAEEKQIPIVFMGDLNAEPTDTIISYLSKHFTDSKQLCKFNSGADGTFNGFEFGRTEMKRIDYVLLSPGDFRVSSYGVLNDAQDGRYPSDHFPVLVKIEQQSEEKVGRSVRTLTTTADGSMRLKPGSQSFSPNIDTQFPVIYVDTSQRFQSMDGFGFTLTGGSAMLLAQMTPTVRHALLAKLFGNAAGQTGVSYLRLSMGASDLDPMVFSYCDTPASHLDTRLPHFSLSRDTLFLLPMLKEILTINPKLKLMATPWSPPAWMKTNGKTKGGSLKPEYYAAYGAYFVKYLEAMSVHGITIDAITIQNEPQHDGNQPSMLMTFQEQANFIKNHLGPALRDAGLHTKILIWDHNCDHPEYPISLLNDPEARKWIYGSAFHMYGGDELALSQVHDAHPDKLLYFTEQWTSSEGVYGSDLKWHTKHILIGTTRNWSKTVLEWNLASDPDHSIHTTGGCIQCKGALTIQGDTFTYNVAHDVIAHASRFVPPGSVRIHSNTSDKIQNVCFESPKGSLACIFLNETDQDQRINLSDGSKVIQLKLPANAVVSVKW